MARMVKADSMINRVCLSGIFTALLFTGTVLAQPNWFKSMSKIKVLKSTRNDVEAAFEGIKLVRSTKDDPRESGWGELVTYETKDGEIEAYYSSGTCFETSGTKGWDIPANRVVSISFVPTGEFTLSQLQIKLTKFRGFPDSDFPAITYRSEQLGVEIVAEGSKIASFEYFYPVSKLEKLRCR